MKKRGIKSIKDENTINLGTHLWWLFTKVSEGRRLFVCKFSADIEDITCLRVDMNFIFECSTQHLRSEDSSLVRYRVEHEKTKFISTSGHVIFCLLYKHTKNNFLTIFRRFLNTFWRFPKMLEKLSEGQAIVSEHFPKISEAYPRFPRKKWWCFDHKVTHLSTL